jgi:hypothetical protein
MLAQSDAVKNKFPQEWLEDLYQTLVEDNMIIYSHSSNNLQQKSNNFVSPTNCGVYQAPTAFKFTKNK